MIGNSDDETNFPHKLLLTNRQVTINDLLDEITSSYLEMTHHSFQKLRPKATLTFNLIKTWKQLVNGLFSANSHLILIL